MKLAVVGVGNAGSRIVNRILDIEQTSGRNLCNGNTLLVNSTKPTFDVTEHVPNERRVTIGDVYWDADGEDIDGNPDLAAEIAREEKNDLNRAFDLLEFYQVDGILVVAGLGGGTGGGAGAVVVDQLKEISDTPVYAVAVLPHDAEGDQAALNAARALQSFVAKADNVLTFDNDAWLEEGPRDGGTVDVPVEEQQSVDEDDSVVDGVTDDDVPVEENTPVAGNASDESTSDESEYARLNVALAERLVTLFAAGEFRDTNASENRMDPSDIIRTLDTGGISSIGYASVDLPQAGGLRAVMRSLNDRFPWLPEPDWLSERELAEEDVSTDAAKINRLVREAATSKLTLPCEISSAERALIVLTGPSRTLSRKGFEGGRYWLEREADIVDVMAGDEPHDRATSLTAVVLFSNVTDVSRIKAMQARAVGQQHAPRTEGENYGTAKSR